MSRCKLGSLLKIQHGYAFKSENYVEASQYRLITLGNFAEGNSFKYNDEKATYYGAEFPSEFILKEGDLIMPMTEQVIGLFGNTAFVPKTEDYTFVLNQRVGKVIYDEKKVNKYYLHYLLATNSVKQQIEARASGTRQRNVSPENIYDVEVDIPDISVQEKIGNLLYSFEEKQINNHKINIELEAVAKSIYNYWFLQFDFPDDEGKPYKSSGGKMIWSEELKREIPEGWMIKKLSELVVTIDNRGKNPPYAEDLTIHPIIDVAALKDEGRALNYLVCSKYVTEDTYHNWFRAGHPQKGDILFSTVGSLAETKIFYPNKDIQGSIAQNVIGLRTGSELYSYIYQVLVEEKEKVIGYKIGSVQPSLKVGHILEHKIIIPPENVLHKYSQIMEDINLKINSNVKEIAEFAELKNFLLPLLMNRQVGFKN